MAAEIFIVNASPLICLAKAGYLHLLEDLGGTLLIPAAVVEEIRAGRPDDPARKALGKGFGHIAPETVASTELTEWGLGAGETAVIALALSRPGATAILDDAAARTCARAHDLPLMGTLAVVLRARQRDVIPSAAAVLHELRAAGLHLDDAVIAAALEASVGEDWERDT
jgi:predicted nucleic acid-binding protein